MHKAYKIVREEILVGIKFGSFGLKMPIQIPDKFKKRNVNRQINKKFIIKIVAVKF